MVANRANIGRNSYSRGYVARPYPALSDNIMIHLLAPLYIIPTSSHYAAHSLNRAGEVIYLFLTASC